VCAQQKQPNELHNLAKGGSFVHPNDVSLENNGQLATSLKMNSK
jgi:hypothetical protein